MNMKIYVRSLLFCVLMSFHACAENNGSTKKQGQSGETEISEDPALEDEPLIVNTRVFGEGEPILVINGGPGFNCNGFEGLAKQLAGRHKVILFDQRGTGQSQLERTDSTTITMDLMVEDMENLRKEMNYDSWVVLGHSFGGMLGSYYASKHPDKIKGLILSSSGGIDLSLLENANVMSGLTETQRDSFFYWTDKINSGDTSFTTKYERAKILAPTYLYNKKYVPVVAKRLTEVDRDINRLVWDDMRRIHFDCKPALKSFEHPVLIIQGREDVIETELAELAHNTFPNSNMVILDSCGHYGWLDQNERYFEEIDQFLNQL